jgi:hypothetical protein
MQVMMMCDAWKGGEWSVKCRPDERKGDDKTES